MNRQVSTCVVNFELLLFSVKADIGHITKSNISLKLTQRVNRLHVLFNSIAYKNVRDINSFGLRFTTPKHCGPL